MNLSGKRVLVIGGAGFIGSHVVAELLRTDVAKVVIFDNFARGKKSNVDEYLLDPRCSIFDRLGVRHLPHADVRRPVGLERR